jgi:hypothetical protein
MDSNTISKKLCTANIPQLAKGISQEDIHKILEAMEEIINDSA